MNPEKELNKCFNEPSTSYSEPRRKRMKTEKHVGSELLFPDFFSSFPASTKVFESKGNQSSLKYLLKFATPSLFKDYNSSDIQKLFQSVNLNNFLQDDKQANQADSDDDKSFITDSGDDILIIRHIQRTSTSISIIEKGIEEDSDVFIVKSVYYLDK